MDIIFEGVSWRDPHGEKVLNAISFEAPANSILALTGDPAGCEAVLALLAGSRPLQEGCIRTGGLTGHMDKGSCVSAYIDNEPLTKGSIYQHIAGDQATFTEIAVLEAAEKALVLDFCWELPDGIHHPVRGLMAWQQQCIRIAHALLQPAPVVLLAERPTYSGQQQDGILTQAMRALAKEKTVVAAVYSPVMLRHADTIIVLKDGAVTESGTHKTLMERNGLYKRLWTAASD